VPQRQPPCPLPARGPKPLFSAGCRTGLPREGDRGKQGREQPPAGEMPPAAHGQTSREDGACWHLLRCRMERVSPGSPRPGGIQLPVLSKSFCHFWGSRRKSQVGAEHTNALRLDHHTCVLKGSSRADGLKRFAVASPSS